MPKVISLDEIPREPKRRIVVLDDGRELPLSLEIALAAGLIAGREVKETAVTEAVERDALKEAMDTAIKLLTRKDQSEAQLRRALAEFGRKAADEVVEKCREWGYLDDRRLAEGIVGDSIRLKKLGPRRIRQELRKRGIDEELAEEVRQERASDEAPLVERAIEALETKRRSYGRLDEQTARRRAMGFLQRRGFDYETVRAAVDQFLGSGSEDGTV